MVFYNPQNNLLGSKMRHFTKPTAFYKLLNINLLNQAKHCMTTLQTITSFNLGK